MLTRERAPLTRWRLRRAVRYLRRRLERPVAPWQPGNVGPDLSIAVLYALQLRLTHWYADGPMLLAE